MLITAAILKVALPLGLLLSSSLAAPVTHPQTGHQDAGAQLRRLFKLLYVILVHFSQIESFEPLEIHFVLLFWSQFFIFYLFFLGFCVFNKCLCVLTQTERRRQEKSVLFPSHMLKYLQRISPSNFIGCSLHS